jgi:hypothetical protein
MRCWMGLTELGEPLVPELIPERVVVTALITLYFSSPPSFFVVPRSCIQKVQPHRHP